MKLKQALLVGLVLTAISILGRESSVNAHPTKTFMTPKIDGLRIDHCVNSERYPDRCNYSATERAANAFCKWNGYRNAAQWSWSSYTRSTVWIWTEKWENGIFQENYYRTQGTGLFNAIECRE